MKRTYRALAILVLAVFLSLGTLSTVWAGEEWCASDPAPMATTAEGNLPNKAKGALADVVVSAPAVAVSVDKGGGSNPHK